MAPAEGVLRLEGEPPPAEMAEKSATSVGKAETSSLLLSLVVVWVPPPRARAAIAPGVPYASPPAPGTPPSARQTAKNTGQPGKLEATWKSLRSVGRASSMRNGFTAHTSGWERPSVRRREAEVRCSHSTAGFESERARSCEHIGSCRT